MNDLQVIVKQEVGSISFNFEEMKQLALEETKKYSGLVLSEDDVAPAKKDRAELNHKFEELETRRKEIERTYMTPLNDFKSQIKEVGKIITDASETIDRQIKAFEDAKRQKKKEEIKQFYDGAVGDVGEYLTFEKIYDARWENVGTSMKSIKEAIESLISSTVMAIETIKDTKSEATDQALEQYKKDLSLTNAITYINKYEAQKAAILAKEEARRKAEEEAKAEQEKERIRREERERLAEVERIRSEERAKTEPKAVVKPEPVLAKDDYDDDPFVLQDEKPFIVSKPWNSYDICAYPNELTTIEAFLESINVSYRRK